MNQDDVERRLSRQPWRRVPREWRGEILRAAQESAEPLPVSRPSFPSLLSTLRAPLSAILWPSPGAWGVLAALWVVIIGINFSLRDRTEVTARKSPPPSPELIFALREQERLLTELMGRPAPLEAAPLKPALPGPRSERRLELWMVG